MTVDQLILEIIEGETVTDQATLLTMLAGRGRAVTQPTLSRHLKKLSVMKVNGRYQRVERSAPERPEYSLVEAPPNLVILKTAPGHAPLLGVIIDRAGITGIAGSLAGDDTVFIAAAAGTDVAALREEIEAALEG
ncbi:MAG: hypothetical protein LC632_04625 [Xanthomonadaceae bacterium]|nr:hypothetical protein [Xanthomonadaceae bacterium]